ncbi:hypothetical protein HDU67_009097 [Dinochytrium kinnereticum]|nr:hypothetical protein HDU67_009097 [Dinochytrium kinnereticum]
MTLDIIVNTQSDMVPILVSADHRQTFNFPGFGSMQSSPAWNCESRPSNSAYMLILPTPSNPFVIPSMSLVPMLPTPIDDNQPIQSNSTMNFFQDLLSLPHIPPVESRFYSSFTPPTTLFDNINIIPPPRFSPKLEESSSIVEGKITTPSSSPLPPKLHRSLSCSAKIKKTPGRRGRKPNPPVIDDSIPTPLPPLPPNTIGFINIVFDPITNDLPEDGVPEFREVHDIANPSVGENEAHPLRPPLLTGIPVPQPTKIVYTVLPKPTQRMLMDREKSLRGAN